MAGAEFADLTSPDHRPREFLGSGELRLLGGGVWTARLF